MRTRRATIIRRRIIAVAVVLAAAISAPVALAATGSHRASTAVHAQVQKDGVVLVSGYDGGVLLRTGGR